MEKSMENTDNAVVLDRQRSNRIKLIIKGDYPEKDPFQRISPTPSVLDNKENMIVTDNIMLTPEQYSEVYKKLNEIYILLNSWRYA